MGNKNKAGVLSARCVCVWRVAAAPSLQSRHPSSGLSGDTRPVVHRAVAGAGAGETTAHQHFQGRPTGDTATRAVWGTRGFLIIAPSHVKIYP